MKKAILLIVLCLGLTIISRAQITDFKAETYTDNAGNELKYRLLKPVNYDSTTEYPLVLFLHGAGERGNDNYSQLAWGAPHFADPQLRRKYPAFVIAPQVPEEESWSVLTKDNKDTTSYTIPMQTKPSTAMKLTLEVLDKLQSEFSIDANRLYVTGLSMGGFGTFDIIERYPGKFAAAIPISGGGDVSRAFLIKDLPLWVFHGVQDEVVNPEYSRAMVHAIQAAGGNPGFTQYPDQGHIGAWVEAYSDPHLYEWLFSKSLSEDKQQLNQQQE